MEAANRFLNQNTPNKFDRFVFWACIIDTMFLPSVWFVAIPYTMPLVFYWAYRRHRYLNRLTEYRRFRTMLILMIFSTFLGLSVQAEFLYNNIVYLVLFTTMFLIYFMFTYYINRYNFSVKKPVFWFIIFIVFLAVLFNIDKSLYQSFKIFWNPRSNASINVASFDDFKGYRYSFIYWDPNNLAYLMNALILYIFLNENTNSFVKVVAVLSLLFVLISCMSNGGFITLYITIALIIIFKVRDFLRGSLNFRLTPISILIFVFSITLIAFSIPKVSDFKKSDVAIESYERMEKNSADPRIKIWKELIDNINFIDYLAIGKGGTTIVNGKSFAPHNGHFFWILGYGFISYYIFMYIIFRKRKITPIKNYVWIIPLLFGFTVNVLLGEIKLMGVFFLLLACSTSPLYLHNNNSYNNSIDA